MRKPLSPHCGHLCTAKWTVRAVFFALALLPLWYAFFALQPPDCEPPEQSPGHFLSFQEVVGAARGLMSLVPGGVRRDPRKLGAGDFFKCDRSSNLTDFCVVRGDVRVNYQTGEIVLVTGGSATPLKREAVRPYPRKWDGPVMDTVTEYVIEFVNFQQGEGGSELTPLASKEGVRKLGKDQFTGIKGLAPVSGGSVKGAPAEEALQCTSYRDGPAVLFSAGGYSGGIFHDFNEVYLPLFQTTEAFNKDVTLIVSDLKGPWWFRGPPRESFVGPFTRHPIRLMGRARDADGNRQGVECFSQLIVGLKHNLCLYNEWGGKETRNEVTAGVRFRDFAPQIGQAMRLPESMWHPKLNKVVLRPGQSPTVCLVQRQKTRRFRNYDALRRVALQEGFRVLDVVFEALRPRKIVQTMRRCDGLIGVHGAGFTNTLFMRPRSVILQVMPFGEYGGGIVVGREYKNIAYGLAATYMEWHVSAEDSTLWSQFAATAVELTDPERLWQTDLIKAMTLYHSQDVTVPAADFRTLLRHMGAALKLQEGTVEVV